MTDPMIGGMGQAHDAQADTDSEVTQEDPRAAADAEIASAQAAVITAENHLAGATAALEAARTRRAELEN
jgi:hypothetical protein